MKTKQKVDSANRPAFIKVSEAVDGSIKSIDYSYEVYVSEKKDDYSHFFIPGYNIFFFAKNNEESHIKAQSVMTSFFNYWIKNQGKKAFLEEIKKLGFKETVAKTSRKYKQSVNRPSIPSNFGEKAFSSSIKADMKIAA